MATSARHDHSINQVFRAKSSQLDMSNDHTMYHGPVAHLVSKRGSGAVRKTKSIASVRVPTLAPGNV